MGSASRARPNNIGKKLQKIREGFNYSFAAMAEKLSDETITILRTDVSRYEKGQREPSLLIVLKYARFADVPMETLVDDNLDLV